ncbi:hypothetical protein LCGC14_1010010 [marine sediment metagenome]|uniref:DNA topoisomerase n=1 Tax=marine sediment metagenome TaxID=412755 RepID=A0A0F9NLX1_9ZZZZ
MAKNIVIIESPGKIKKYKEYLGSEYKILGTFGHCVDLPEKKLSVNIKKDFEPTFEVKEDSKDIIKSIKTACKKAKSVYLMTDEDREGEAVAVHIYNQIKGLGVPVFRASTNEITKKGIQNAIDNAGELDYNKYNAYLARRILDRVVGYKLSFLTKQSTGGRSAGRVQSAVLRIIVDREKEILAFIPEEYWILTANLLSSKNKNYTAVLTDKIKVPNAEKATQIYDEVLKGSPIVASVNSKEVVVKPWPPFTTLPMIASASTILGWQMKRTMDVAQDLYNAGTISYHRTDSPFMAQEALQSVRAFVDHTYGNQYLPDKSNFYSSKKGSQEAHECCRPTDVSNTGSSLSGDKQKLYQLIWKRAVASQMAPGCDRRVKVITKISGYDFISNGSQVLFDGFRKCWNYSKKDDLILPDLFKGEKCTLKSLLKEQKFTSPPSRFSDASLAKTCEKEQLTRPATIKGVVETLKARKYITQAKKSFNPTELGIKVVDFLVAADMCFVDIKFTGRLEELLDEIQGQTKDKVDVLNDFWTRLKLDIENGKKVKEQQEITKYKCPKCNGFLLLKHSNFGPFIVCQNSKKLTKKEKEEGIKSGCDYLANVGEDGSPVEKVKKKLEYADFICKECKGKMVKRKSKFGTEFYGCENFSTGCRCTANLDGVFSKPKSKKWSKKK